MKATPANKHGGNRSLMGATVVFKTKPRRLFRSRSLVTGSDMTPLVGTVECVPSLLKSLWQQNIVQRPQAPLSYP